MRAGALGFGWMINQRSNPTVNALSEKRIVSPISFLFKGHQYSYGGPASKSPQLTGAATKLSLVRCPLIKGRQCGGERMAFGPPERIAEGPERQEYWEEH